MVDFGLTAADYAQHRAGFPDSLYSRLRAFEIGLPGQRIVDLGTGTGTLARGFALRGCHVLGIDPSIQMLSQAGEIDRSAGVSVEYRCAAAENTDLPDNYAEVVSAGQCWHWFDRPKAAGEVARILQPGGKVLIAHFDWVPLNGNVVAGTEALILKHNPDWNMMGGTGLYPQWLVDLGEAGFEAIETFSYSEPAVYSPEAWRGRIRASAGVGASLSPEKVAAFDRDLAALLAENFPGDRLAVPHRVFAVIAANAK
ncbi:MAG: class I SAM-dependent methyltransferase [Anaerolineae bacterium]|nr:class I SAM-dependent methyltransferase [Anaerolineae bacterium]